MAQQAKELAAGAREISGVKVLVTEVAGCDSEALKLLADGPQSPVRCGPW